MWRTRWNVKFQEGIVRGAKNYDEVLMNLAGTNAPGSNGNVCSDSDTVKLA
jgi:hypothetical protein